MTSRDFEYLTLRNLQPYNPDGTAVSTGYVLATNDKGVGYWTNTLSTITVSSFNVSTMIYVSSFSTVLTVNYLSALSASISTLDVSTLTVSTVFGSSIMASSIMTSSLFATGASVSTLLVSSLAGPPGTSPSDYLYWNTGLTPNQWSVGSTMVHLGSNAGSTSQGSNAVAIGNQAGQDGQGGNAIAIGHLAGQVNQSTNTIVMNASGGALNTLSSNACYIDPIRGPVSNMTPLFYNTANKEITYGPPAFLSTFSTLVTSSLGVGISAPTETIDVEGNINVSSFIFSYTSVYTTPGVSSIVSIPPFVRRIQFEMIGGGGAGLNGAQGGTGGYIKGVITLPPNVSTIKVFVGSPGGGFAGGSPYASYITVPVVGPLFAIAGAGGAANVSGTGGYGGGGAFAAGYEQGGNGSCAGTGGSSGGATQGGGGSDSSAVTCVASITGNGQNYAGNYEQSAGGSFGLFFTLPGGSGYAGGGAHRVFSAASSGQSGGGSSYIDTTYINRLVNFSSFNGSNVTTELPGYGRSGQGGYVTITMVTNSTSVNANGDIRCRNLYALSTIQSASTLTNVLQVASTITASSIVTSTLTTSSIVVGTGVGTYPLEINQAGVNNSFTSGYLFNSTLANTFSLGPATVGNISLKASSGIWAANFYASSDSRIKTDVKLIEDAGALEVMRLVKPVTYRYIDTRSHHGDVEYGFIAQDVRPLLPYAVHTEIDFVPNIYDLGDAASTESGATRITLRQRTVEHIRVGDVVKLLDFNETPRTCVIARVTTHELVVEAVLDSLMSEGELSETHLANGIQKNTFFVYGTRVDDFHVLDKQAIYNVTVGALQEMDRTIVQQGLHIQKLEKILYEFIKSISPYTYAYLVGDKKKESE